MHGIDGRYRLRQELGQPRLDQARRQPRQVPQQRERAHSHAAHKVLRNALQHVLESRAESRAAVHQRREVRSQSLHQAIDQIHRTDDGIGHVLVDVVQIVLVSDDYGACLDGGHGHLEALQGPWLVIQAADDRAAPEALHQREQRSIEGILRRNFVPQSKHRGDVHSRQGTLPDRRADVLGHNAQRVEQNQPTPRPVLLESLHQYPIDRLEVRRHEIARGLDEDTERRARRDLHLFVWVQHAVHKGLGHLSNKRGISAIRSIAPRQIVSLVDRPRRVPRQRPRGDASQLRHALRTVQLLQQERV
mmetsp:Transcript_19098/g.40018  ORF Transcript_19098/g.40018 Transcript_19098/m.40018 type:complete len:304 (+) Transcript_19098:2375-3286(+)